MAQSVKCCHASSRTGHESELQAHNVKQNKKKRKKKRPSRPVTQLRGDEVRRIPRAPGSVETAFGNKMQHAEENSGPRVCCRCTCAQYIHPHVCTCTTGNHGHSSIRNTVLR